MKVSSYLISTTATASLFLLTETKKKSYTRLAMKANNNNICDYLRKTIALYITENNN